MQGKITSFRLGIARLLLGEVTFLSQSEPSWFPELCFFASVRKLSGVRWVLTAITRTSGGELWKDLLCG